MEPWIPPVITAVATLIAAFGGYLLSGHQAKQHRAADQDRTDKESQRQAVARFLENSKKLETEFGFIQDKVVRYSEVPMQLDENQLIRIVEPRISYHEGMRLELEILDLHLHDNYVRKSFNQLSQVYKRQYKDLLRLTDNLDMLALKDMEDQISQVEKILSYGPETDDLPAARDALIGEARVRLRLKPAGGEEHSPLVTPYDPLPGSTSP